jgi:hypothetical protein
MKMARDPFDEYFRRIMKRFFKDLEEIEKEFGKFEKKPIDELPKFVFRRPSRVERGGFSISISSNGKNPPKIEMRRFGPGGKWEKIPLEKEGIVPIAKIPKEKPVVKKPEKPRLPEVKEKMIPEYNVSVDIKEVTITLNAEGVESKENVGIKFYPESVEIYAVSPKLNKGYFCTVAIPASVDKQDTAIEVEKDKVIIKIPRRFSTA